VEHTTGSGKYYVRKPQKGLKRKRKGRKVKVREGKMQQVLLTRESFTDDATMDPSLDG
jgi:hypothetical protein